MFEESPHLFRIDLVDFLVSRGDTELVLRFRVVLKAKELFPMRVGVFNRSNQINTLIAKFCLDFR